MALTRRTTTKSAGLHIFNHQFLEYFYMDAVPDDVILVQGRRKGNSDKKKLSFDTIADGSIIAVNEGQTAIAVENRIVTAVYDTPGEHTFNSDSSKSVFSGATTEDIKDELAKRKNGELQFSQRIFFVNRREMKDVPFDFNKTVELERIDPATGKNMTIVVSCRGSFSIRVSDPAKLVASLDEEVMGNLTVQRYGVELKNEIMKIISAVIAERVEAGDWEPEPQPDDFVLDNTYIPMTISGLYGSKLDEAWERRGICVGSLLYTRIRCYKVNSTEEKKTNLAASMLGDGRTSGNPLLSGMETSQNSLLGNMDASGNPLLPGGSSTGAAAFFFGKEKSQEASDRYATCEQWTCSCGNINKGKFCVNCGQKRET